MNDRPSSPSPVRGHLVETIRISWRDALAAVFVSFANVTDEAKDGLRVDAWQALLEQVDVAPAGCFHLGFEGNAHACSASRTGG